MEMRSATATLTRGKCPRAHCWIGLLVALLLCGTAHADRKKALEFYNAGVKAFTVEHYDEAIYSFEKAYEQVPSPNFLYNIGISHLHAGRVDKALDFFEKCLARAGAEAEQRCGDAQKRIEDIHSLQARQEEAKAKAANAHGATEAPAAALQVEQPTVHARPASKPVWKRWELWVGLAVGVVVVGAAVGLGVGLSQTSEHKLPAWQVP
jgi:tetratricopeptide (TPR) repeat protein